MRTKYLRVGFYEPVVTNVPARTFDSILRRFELDIPSDERCVWEEHGEEPVRLQFARRSSTLWNGDMMRIRSHEDLRKGRRNGTTEDIPFEPGEGLGENTAFLHHPQTNTLLIHEHRGGVSVSMFARYFKNFGEVAGLELRPMIRPEAIERAERLPIVRSFEIHLAGVHDPRVYRNPDRAARSVLDMMSIFDAPKAKIVLETGVRRGNPNPPSLRNVIEAVRGMLRNRPNEHPQYIEKIVVAGLEGQDLQAEAVINLLEDRLVEIVPVVLGGRERIADATRFNAVNTAWNIHRESIQRFYGDQGQDVPLV